MPEEKHKLFGELAIEMGLINQDQLDQALRRQNADLEGEKIGAILVKLGFMEWKQVEEIICQQRQIKIVDLSTISISQEIRDLVDGGIACLYRVVPIGIEDNSVVLACSQYEVFDLNAKNLEELLSRLVKMVFAHGDQISLKLAEHYGLQIAAVESIIHDVEPNPTVTPSSRTLEERVEYLERMHTELKLQVEALMRHATQM